MLDYIPLYLHRLLAEVFISNPEGKKYINHKDGNKLNNELHNLEWVTAKENVIHAFESGLMNPAKQYGEKNPFAKFSDTVISKVKNYKGLATLKETAKLFNMSISHVWAIQNNKVRNGGEIHG